MLHSHRRNGTSRSLVLHTRCRAIGLGCTAGGAEGPIKVAWLRQLDSGVTQTKDIRVDRIDCC